MQTWASYCKTTAVDSQRLSGEVFEIEMMSWGAREMGGLVCVRVPVLPGRYSCLFSSRSVFLSPPFKLSAAAQTLKRQSHRQCVYETLRSCYLCVSGAKGWNSDLMLSQISPTVSCLYTKNISELGQRLFFLLLQISHWRCFLCFLMRRIKYVCLFCLFVCFLALTNAVCQSTKCVNKNY